MAIDVSSFSHQNLWLSKAGELVVRDAVHEDLAASSLAAVDVFVGGFSIPSPNTGEVFHYLFTRNTSTGVGTLHVTDEEFDVLQTVNLGSIPSKLVVTHATLSSPHVSSLEVLINGPDIPPLYGFAGSGLVVAEKQEDEDPYTTALDIMRGIVVGFAGRAVVGSGKNVYFSNAYGTRVVDGEATFTGPRTFTAINIGDLASQIYGLHVTDGGALLIATDTGVWGLPPEAVASGVQVHDLFSLVSTYRATGYQTTALGPKGLYGLGELGLVRVRDLSEIALDEPRYPRAISEPIEADDYRSLKLWPWERGVLVSQPHAVCVVDDTRGFRSWQVPAVNDDWTVLGVLTQADGSSMFISPDRVWSFYGQDTDLGEAEAVVVGVAAGQLAVAPERSSVVREVTTSSDTPGAQKCSVRGSSIRSKLTPQRGAVIGTHTWSATERYEERALRSRRHKFAIRTDDPTVEVAAEHSGSRLSLIDVVLKGQGRRRP